MNRNVGQAFQPDTGKQSQAGKPDLRPAIATLEMVMVLPLLLMLMAGLFLMGRAAVRKETAATSARALTWAQVPNAAPGAILQLNHDPMASAVSATGSQIVDLRGMFNGATLQANSRGTVLGRPWDVQDLPFAPGQGNLNPHQQELIQAASNVNGAAQTLSAGLATFRLGLDPNSNPVLIAASVAGQMANPQLKLDSFTLKFGTSPTIQGFRPGVQAAKAAALAANMPAQAAKLDRIDKLMSLVPPVFDNLYEAARGRVGTWDPNLGNNLLKSVP
jgi:hypothetical protein